MNTTFVILYKNEAPSFYYKTKNIKALSAIAALRAFEEEFPKATFKVMYDRSIDLMEIPTEE